ncbi:AAA family ATPase [Siminovitchia sp. FSL H7-0308]|uniref:AAA family ATPase n=1 Tax=Siminovitchia sp. FSL H7-0308 TaxID=2921432 RepID=UPI0030EEEA3C
MGKIVMPKNSALLHEVESVLKIYYEANDWLHNSVYKERLKELIGPDQYSSSYTKKAQITSYFGFTVWEDINNPQSKRRITESGKAIYEAIRDNNKNRIQEILMQSLETVKFGRENYGSPESDSDVEPPNLYIRAILDLEYLTYREFAYLLWKLEDVGGNYTDSLQEIRRMRTENSFVLDEEASKYADCKPIMVLVRWGFLAEQENVAGPKRIIVEPTVLEQYEKRLRNLKVYNIDKDVSDPIIDRDRTMEINRLTGGNNILLYGVPGSGKSHEIKTKYCNDFNLMERVVFHPDYMNTDFVGQILPTVKGEGEEKEITYDFTPGPFTRVLKKAIENPGSHYYLVIEEINRGNAPAIFGEIFQLLDRDDDGKSSYEITNYNIANEIFNEKERPIYIPSNLHILATMNTADQNVFTLDTAFQRRWNMKMIENDVTKAEHADIKILDTNVTWKKFNTTINNQIITSSASTLSSEDKRLGAYFVTKNVLQYYSITENREEISEKYKVDSSDTERINRIIQDLNSRFGDKVIKYLWDDAFKFSREDLFDSSYKSLEKVLDDFNRYTADARFNIFNQDIREDLFLDSSTEGNINEQ